MTEDETAGLSPDATDGRSYSIHELARLAGVSVRTLHHYDAIGLLVPSRQANGYRVYGAHEVRRLQLIMLYRATGMQLSYISRCLDDPANDTLGQLRTQLARLIEQRKEVDGLIANVQRTIEDITGEGNGTMKDAERFEGFKRELIAKNEREYGQEARDKYGDDAVDASNAKLMGMTQAEYDQTHELELKIADGLREAMATGDPAGKQAQDVCDLHRQWLCRFWKEGTYNKQAHLGLAEMYVADDRFKAHYDAIAPGAAEFLRDALKVYCR